MAKKKAGGMVPPKKRASGVIKKKGTLGSTRSQGPAAC